MPMWKEQRKAFGECSGVVPSHNLYVTWESRHFSPLSFVSIFLYALKTGRQPLAAKNGLLCEAYYCGIPSSDLEGLHVESVVRDDSPMHIFSGNFSLRRERSPCLIGALRCTNEELLEPRGFEGCVESRAMRLLLPNLKLRPKFLSDILSGDFFEWKGQLELRTMLVETSFDASIVGHYDECATNCFNGTKIFVTECSGDLPDRVACLADVSDDDGQVSQLLKWHFVASSKWSVALGHRGQRDSPFTASALAASSRSIARPPFRCWCQSGIYAQTVSYSYPRAASHVSKRNSRYIIDAGTVPSKPFHDIEEQEDTIE